MKTAVEAIFVGKARRYNGRFLQMCSHHLIEPVACTPASGWEKGQVENQVGNLRDQMFRPKPRVKNLTELNAWLEDQCIAYAKRTQHPEFKDRTIWDVFEEERASLMQLRGPFDGFVEKAVRASTTCLIMADHNRYSVDARAAGRRFWCAPMPNASWCFWEMKSSRIIRVTSSATRPFTILGTICRC